jgi:hypothetical protein
MRGQLQYTVGAGNRPDSWFIPMPWHLRGSVTELIEQFRSVSELPNGCIGVEYSDGGVQLLRYRFPWLRSDSD